MKQLQKIQEMETILNEMNDMLEEVNASFEKRKALRPQINWEIPEDIPHGVLSEDGAWNAFVFEYWLAKELQKFTKLVLKR